MATSTLLIPQTGLTSPTTWYKTRDGLKTEMKKVWDKYGKYFKKFSETSKVPAEVLFAFTMIESGGNPLAGGETSPTQGLMQWNRTYAAGKGNPDFTLTKEFTKGRLSEVEKEVLKRNNITFDATGNTRSITQKDLQNAELNILIGSIILGQYMDKEWGTENGALRMDRVIALYNWGLGGFTKNNIAKKNLQEVLASIPTTTKVYVQKMLGLNGTLDIATSDLKEYIA
jgi:soluble lytic murein transglycosylase-like protein